nr:NADH dehydrogenase subunit 6 [Platydemus manokwari]
MILFFLFVFFLFLLVVVQLSLSTFLLGVYVLTFCLMVSLFLAVLNMVWYSFIFFLIYVGGILVLFFYIISLNSNPNFSEVLSYTKGFYFFYFVFFVVFLFFFVLDSGSSFVFFFPSILEDNSVLLFSSNNSYFLFIVSIYLVFILFVVSYMSSSVKSALRPISSF